MSPRVALAVRGVAPVVAASASWLSHAKDRGFHVVFADDYEARWRVATWRRECEEHGEPCILVIEEGMEARIEVWRAGAASPVAYRGAVNDAPEKAAELARRYGAWGAAEPMWEPIDV